MDLHQIIDFVRANKFECYIGYNILITPLEEPDANSSKLYRYFYKVTHLIAFNLNDAFQRRQSSAPQIPNVSQNGVIAK
jgi:hypothetical protein